MTTGSISSAKLDLRRPRDILPLLRRAWQLNAPLTLLGVAMLSLFLVTLVGIVADPRVITGVPAWVKPAKFAISTSIYSFTLVYLLRFVKGHPRLVNTIALLTTVAFGVEIAVIVIQVIRGTTSHFNVSTPLNATLWFTMAGFIVVIYSMALLLAALLFIQRIDDPVWGWALRCSVLLALIGMSIGFLMTSPTAAQLAAAKAGNGMPIVGAHTVGLADGGPGLPFVGWSTVGGDLRIPHFVGLHGFQALLIVGFLLTLPVARAVLSQRQRVALVWTAALGYFGLIALLTWQALRAQSIIHPDGLTLAAGSILLAGVGVAVGAIVLRGRANDAAPA